MAEEIRMTAGLTIDKSNLKLNIPTETFTATLTGTRFIRNCQNISTSYEAVTVSDLGSDGGVARFKNLDATNYVEFGREVSSAFYGFVKLLPGESAVMRLSTRTIFGRANTAAVDVDICIAEA